ncbi:ROK family transcriptional regulator [Salipaludibacillus aurantiacus]|nr:ROK family transcriptional regulator [Salipaludibacillus aurantiacus]
MYVPKTGSFEGMKSMNRSTILNIIRLEGSISRAEIAKRTKLTPPTVGTLVQELLEEKLIVEERGVGKIQGGRKPLMLSVNSTAFYAVGIYAAAEVIRTVMATLDGTIIAEKEIRMKSPPPMDMFLESLASSVYEVLKVNSTPLDSVIGIGVGMHGLVDSEKGIAIFSPHLNLENIPLKRYLEDEFSVPVLVENDVRTLTLAESWFGKGKGVSHFLCVSIGLGIGSGIVIDNKLYHGPAHSAGEIGHTIVDVNGPRCHCGNYGCLEAYASEFAIMEQVQKRLRLGKRSVLQEWVEENGDLTMDMIYEASKRKDPLTLEVIEDAGRYLGIAIGNVVNMLTPSKVVLEGKLFRTGEPLLSPLEEMMRKCSVRSVQDTTELAVSSLGKKGMVTGAFTLVINQLFDTGKFLKING